MEQERSREGGYSKGRPMTAEEVKRFQKESCHERTIDLVYPPAGYRWIRFSDYNIDNDVTRHLCLLTKTATDSPPFDCDTLNRLIRLAEKEADAMDEKSRPPTQVATFSEQQAEDPEPIELEETFSEEDMADNYAEGYKAALAETAALLLNVSLSGDDKDSEMDRAIILHEECVTRTIAAALRIKALGL